MPLGVPPLYPRSDRRRRVQADRSQVLSKANASSWSVNNGSHKSTSSDSSIIRGAEIIREQIRRQLYNEEDGYGKSAESIHESLLDVDGLDESGEPSRETAACSFSSDEFSDPWSNGDDLGATGTAESSPLEESRKTDSVAVTKTLWSGLWCADRPRGEDASDRELSNVYPLATKSEKAGDRKIPTKAVSLGSFEFVENDYGSDDEVHTLDDGEQEGTSPGTSYLPKKFQDSSAHQGYIVEIHEIAEDAEDKFIAEGEKRQGPPTPADYRNSAPASAPAALVPSSVPNDIPSPLSVEYSMLLRDPGYQHAQEAGFLWQSLVGQQVRFPSRWWNGARMPPMGLVDWGEERKWQYYWRCKIDGNTVLNKLVASRSSAGRLLLHIVVMDLVTWKPVQDIAIGCFHPNARGIRQSEHADRTLEDSRDVWLAVRKRSDAVSVVDDVISNGMSWDEVAGKSPLGLKPRVTNHNVRAVFGEKPPLETVFVPESELYERLSGIVSSGESPPVAILEEFVFA